MTIPLLILFGTCIVQLQYVRLIFACAKKLFNVLTQATNHVLNASPCVNLVIFPLGNKQILFLKFGQGIYVFEETKVSTQGVIGDVYCLTCSDESVFTFQPTEILFSRL